MEKNEITDKFRRALVELDEFNYDTNIVLEGKVGVYKPKFVEKEMTHIEFYLYLNSLFG